MSFKDSLGKFFLLPIRLINIPHQLLHGNAVTSLCLIVAPCPGMPTLQKPRSLGSSEKHPAPSSASWGCPGCWTAAWGVALQHEVDECGREDDHRRGSFLVILMALKMCSLHWVMQATISRHVIRVHLNIVIAFTTMSDTPGISSLKGHKASEMKPREVLF